MPLAIFIRPPPPPLPEGFVYPKELPSITEQSKWETGFYRFRDEGEGFKSQVEYFNCGIVNWRGDDWLITRRRAEQSGPPGRNTIVAWKLVDNQPQRDYPVLIRPVFSGENWEDPRITVVDGKLLLSWCNFRWNSLAHQCVGYLTDRWFVPYVVRPEYGRNGSHLLGNSGHEKNWTWFQHDGIPHLLYSTVPHMVCETRGFQVSREHSTLGSGYMWSKWGEMRGGSPPVRIGDEYWCFFHSSSKWVPPRRRYHMGAYAFEAKPPFKVTRISKKPILSGSEADRRNPGAPVVVFPCGSLLRNGEWLVVGGSNDCQCFWTRIPHEELLGTMRKL